MENRITWDEYFMSIAALSALRSRDPNTKVGACIVSEDNKILSIGYNGAPRKYDDDKINWNRDTTKPLTEQKYPYMCHSELNAVLNYSGSIRDLKDARVYVTLFPCNECAKLLIQAGIKEVIYCEDKHHDDEIYVIARELFDECERQTSVNIEINID